MTDQNGQRCLMSGNEAMARGAIEARIGFCASYPGTPSTEITNTLMREAKTWDIYVEWSVNEKVALEAATGASWMGVPALCPMKSLGLNVAADFLLNVNLSGTGPGGLVVIVCDDPRGHSSSNEQDSRFYAKAAQVPLLEPSTVQQAKDIVKYAFDLSQRHQIPVIIRSTTRLSHSRAPITLSEVTPRGWSVQDRLPSRLFNVPDPHLRHRELLEKTRMVSEEFSRSGWNLRLAQKDPQLTIVSSGMCRLYATEASEKVPSIQIEHLGLVTTYPPPVRILRDVLNDAESILFVEEVDPFVEDEIRALSSQLELERAPIFRGKRTGEIPAWGELNVDIVRDAICSSVGITNVSRPPEVMSAVRKAENLLIDRPLTFCAGCTHRNVYWVLRRLRRRMQNKSRLIVTGDIGCYSLGVFYDTTMETMQAMGSGIGTACGIGQLHRFGMTSKTVAVAGDSTFFHACIPALINAKHQQADLTFLILDNRATAMTGFQTHPGIVDPERQTRAVEIDRIVASIEPDLVLRVDATRIRDIETALEKAVNRSGLKVVILQSECRLSKREDREERRSIIIDESLCRQDRCRICVEQYGCVALVWDKNRAYPTIIETDCSRCGACIDVCPVEAIRREN